MRAEFKKIRPGVRKTRAKAKAYASRTAVANLSAPMARAVQAIVRGNAETKTVAFYQSANNGTVTPPPVATGLFSGRGWCVQNTTISSNVTDILQLIPYVAQGINDWQRIGQKINPVSLTVKGAVRVNIQYLGQPLAPLKNVSVYLYVLQHVSLKDYTNLRLNNNFSQLLDTHDGTTTQFNGEALSPHLPINKEAYRLLARKKITLKYGGSFGPSPVVSNASVSNAHSWYSNYSFNLSKHLPKTLMFPEALTPALPPSAIDQPSNSSIFMAIGYVDELNTVPADVQSNIEQTYVSELRFKDM
jgi:hypothetical protein